MADRVQRQRVAVYGLARRDGAVLLVRARPAAGGGASWWLPGGGVHFGESPEDCLSRELREETGLRLERSRLSTATSDVTELRTEPVLLHSVRLVYDVQIGTGELVAEPDGSTDGAAWIDEAKVAALPLADWVRRLWEQ